jgi:hypothetical protein
MGTLIFLLIVGGLGYAGYRTYHKQKAAYEEANPTTAVVAGQTQVINSAGQAIVPPAGKTKLKGDRIISEWNALCGGAQGKAEHYTRLFIRQLQDMGVPSLKVQYKDVTGGTIGALFKPTRRYLSVENKYFKGYRTFVGAKDYGKQLSISCYLTVEQSFFGKVMLAASKSLWVAALSFPLTLTAKLFQLGKGFVIPEMMDMFDREELNCYITTVDNAAKNAAKEMMKELDLDFTKMDIKSRGFHNLK